MKIIFETKDKEWDSAELFTDEEECRMILSTESIIDFVEKCNLCDYELKYWEDFADRIVDDERDLYLKLLPACYGQWTKEDIVDEIDKWLKKTYYK